MDKQYLIQFFYKYSRADSTEEERNFVKSYYNLFQNEPDIFDSLDLGKKTQFKNEIKGQIWDRIIYNERLGHNKKLKQRTRIIWLTAAAAIVLILAMRIFFTYNPSQVKATPENIVVKHAENRIIFLADGSKVVVSNGSRLNYPSSFSGKKKREVYLEGQAFFDIQHDAQKPFIVHTGNLQTTVLGTAFNIKDMPNEKEITVSVVRGKVTVTDRNIVLGTIIRNQEIKYDKQKHNYEMKVIGNEHYLEWKSSDLFLDNVSVAEAAKILEERYKVTITISDRSVCSRRFTVTFPKNGNLEQALKSICEFNGVTYVYDKNDSTVIIINKSKNK
jgi:transmembrane sensor